MIANLSDFSSEELLFSSILFKEKMDECNSKIELIMKFQDSLTKTELLFHWMGQRDKASLWLTQIDTALLLVKEREISLKN